MRRGSPGRGTRTGLGLGVGMSRPVWGPGPLRPKLRRSGKLPSMAPNQLSAQMIARSRSVAEARWSPGGGLVGWLDGFDGRFDLVIAPSDGSLPPRVVSAEAGLTPVGGYGGGAWSWAVIKPSWPRRPMVAC